MINNKQKQSLIDNKSMQQRQYAQFFGKILKPGQVFNFDCLIQTHQVIDVLIISNLALVPYSNDCAYVYIKKGGEQFLIATLSRELPQLFINIALSKSNKALLFVKGKGIVHITGYHDYIQNQQKKQKKDASYKKIEIDVCDKKKTKDRQSDIQKNNLITKKTIKSSLQVKSKRITCQYQNTLNELDKINSQNKVVKDNHQSVVVTKQDSSNSKILNQDLQFMLFKVPTIEIKTDRKQNIVIGIIDASGSMRSYWNQLTKFWNQKLAQLVDFIIFFDDYASVQTNTYISDNLSDYGGGLTNILSAFKILEDSLLEYPQSTSVTIIFISDGHDTVNQDKGLRQKMRELRGGRGRNITMLCLGIGSGFPTKIAMDLRQLYHTGDQKIPALHLIEYASQKAFFNKFQMMADCFNSINKVKVLIDHKKWKEYPWLKQGKQEINSGQWILVCSQIKFIRLAYNHKQNHMIQITPFLKLSLDDLVDCFRGWTQKIQMLSMDVKKMMQTSGIAELTANSIKRYTQVYEKYHKFYILSQKPLGLRETFGERARRLAVKNIGSRIKWFMDELTIIAKGTGIGGLDQYEAAKRLGIGTITGRYHQKALALKGITKQDFQKIKSQFQGIFLRIKLSSVPSQQESSIFTLQNQKEVFQQAEFLEGLRLCQTQFDLVQTFPVIGYSLKVKRYDGSMLNPWKVQVLQLAKTHKSIDSVYLANNNNKYQLSIGDGNIEQINAVLPLFSQRDIQMSPLLNSKLFKLAISFMVVQNIDTFHQEAYLALLASTYVFLLKQPKSQWRDNLFNLIHSSVLVTYWQTKQFKIFIEKALINPYSLFTSKQKEDHTDITKVMLLVQFIYQQKLLAVEQINHYVDLVMVHYVEKTYIQNEFKISRIAKMKVHQQKQFIKDFTSNNGQKQFNAMKSYEQLKKIVDNGFSMIIKSGKIDLTFDQKIFLHRDQQRRVTYDHIKAFYERIKKQQLQNIEFIYYFGHALKGKTPQIYKIPIIRDIQIVKKMILKSMQGKSLSPQEGRIVKDVKKLIQDEYIDIFRKTHFGIFPMSKSKLKQECLERGLNYKDLQLNEISGMAKNACMSPNCSYYLLPLKNRELEDHMRLWRKALPSRFHIYVVPQLKQQKSTHQICDQLFNQGYVNLKKHHKSQEQVLKYIKKIKKYLKAQFKADII